MYNRPFKGNCTADVAHGENEFDPPSEDELAVILQLSAGTVEKTNSAIKQKPCFYIIVF